VVTEEADVRLTVTSNRFVSAGPPLVPFVVRWIASGLIATLTVPDAGVAGGAGDEQRNPPVSSSTVDRARSVGDDADERRPSGCSPRKPANEPCHAAGGRALGVPICWICRDPSRPAGRSVASASSWSWVTNTRRQPEALLQLLEPTIARAPQLGIELENGSSSSNTDGS